MNIGLRGFLGGMAGGAAGYSAGKQAEAETASKILFDKMQDIREKNLARFQHEQRMEEINLYQDRYDQRAFVENQNRLSENAANAEIANLNLEAEQARAAQAAKEAELAAEEQAKREFNRKDALEMDKRGYEAKKAEADVERELRIYEAKKKIDSQYGEGSGSGGSDPKASFSDLKTLIAEIEAAEAIVNEEGKLSASRLDALNLMLEKAGQAKITQKEVVTPGFWRNKKETVIEQYANSFAETGEGVGISWRDLDTGSAPGAETAPVAQYDITGRKPAPSDSIRSDSSKLAEPTSPRSFVPRTGVTRSGVEIMPPEKIASMQGSRTRSGSEYVSMADKVKSDIRGVENSIQNSAQSLGEKILKKDSSTGIQRVQSPDQLRGYIQSSNAPIIENARLMLNQAKAGVMPKDQAIEKVVSALRRAGGFSSMSDSELINMLERYLEEE